MTTLGLYPIVDSIQWLKKLLPLGVHTFQLRIKNKMSDALEKEIIESISLCKRYGAQLFINDHWELAIQHKADGVHLGQEDVDHADTKKILGAGLQLGISAHTPTEIKKALTFKPSYIAIGPIFPTTSKRLAYTPIGIAQLKQYCDITNIPIVAIGGINSQNISAILNTGVSGIAILSAIDQTQLLLDKIRAHPHA